MSEEQLRDYLDYQINTKKVWIYKFFNIFNLQIWIIKRRKKDE